MKLRKKFIVFCFLILTALFIDGILILSFLIKRDTYEYTNYRNTPIANSESNAAQVKSLKPVNLMILGLDDEETRSDVIIVFNFDPDSGRLNLLSMPRDTRVKVKRRHVKMNSLIGMGNEEFVKGKVEEITGLHIDYYLTMNFKGFRKIVDLLGGVEVDVPFDMNYDDPYQNFHVHLKKGSQILNGQKAEGFVRYRKGNKRGEGYDDGDIGRIRMQQTFIKAMVEQKIKLKYILKVNDLFYILQKYVKTDINIDDIEIFINDVIRIDINNINAYSAPGEARDINGTWYYIIDATELKRLTDENFFK